jgi:hypothetical protein
MCRSSAVFKKWQATQAQEAFAVILHVRTVSIACLGLGSGRKRQFVKPNELSKLYHRIFSLQNKQNLPPQLQSDNESA